MKAVRNIVAIPFFAVVIAFCLSFVSFLQKSIAQEIKPNTADIVQPSPSPSISPTEFNDLNGKVTYKDTDFGLEDVEIHETINGEKRLLTQTDSSGLYSIMNLTVGSHQLEFTRDLFSSNVQVVNIKPRNEINRLDISLDTEKSNAVGGYIHISKNLTGNTESFINETGLIIKLRKTTSPSTQEYIDATIPVEFEKYYDQNNTFTGFRSPYVFNSSKLRQGQYTLVILQEDQANTALQTTSFSFSKNSGQEKRIDFTLNLTSQTHSVHFAASNYLKDLKKFSPLTAQVRLKSLVTNRVWSGSTPIQFNNLPDGSYEYTITFQLNGKTIQEKQNLSLIGRMKNIYVRYNHLEDFVGDEGELGVKCQKHQVGSVTDFYFCGGSISMLNDPALKGALETIATKLTSLRAHYGFQNLPQSILISNGNDINAMFVPGLGDFGNANSTNCPYPVLVTSDGYPSEDKIIITTGIIREFSKDPTILSNMITHEFGHAFQWRNGCADLISEKNYNEFLQLRELGGKLNFHAFFNALKDGNYATGWPQAGHPEDNEGETFASAFTKGTDYRHLDYVNKGGLTEELKRILDKIVSHTLQPTRSPF